MERAQANVMNKAHFNGEIMKSKSGAAAGMCEWVINICKYFRVYQVPVYPETRSASTSLPRYQTRGE
eukprot:746436-Rhodomonas_salina.3